MDHDDDVVGFGSAIPAFLQEAPPQMPPLEATEFSDDD